MNHKQIADIQLDLHKHRRQRPEKPAWLKVKLPTGEPYQRIKEIVTKNNLHTVCESAACPNRGQCWSRSTATIMILGNICTRSCGFCNVITGRPTELDQDEPRRVADAVFTMKLRYVVITSVNRDELKDGGASIWAATILAVRERCPNTLIEVLIPDFCGNQEALKRVLEAGPDVVNHNMETVPRLYSTVRPQGNYARSLDIIRYTGELGLTTKSGLMMGLGETDDEVRQVMRELRAVGCDLLTLGQYLQPTANHLSVERFVPPSTFEELQRQGMELGYRNVFAGPLVRSSYHAEEQARASTRKG